MSECLLFVVVFMCSFAALFVMGWGLAGCYLLAPSGLAQPNLGRASHEIALHDKGAQILLEQFYLSDAALLHCKGGPSAGKTQ